MIRLLLRALSVKPTPNPLCKKFVPDIKLETTETFDIPDIKFAVNSPLAQQLFSVQGVTRVFFSSEFISITKTDFADWEALQPDLIKIISAHIDSKSPLFSVSLEKQNKYNLESEVESIIEEIIEGRIRPHLQEDGGDIKYHGFNEETGIVSLEMQGSCAGCPSSFATLKDGIEKMLMFYIPEVKGVENLS
jgi:Fe-S cluster biogenesis protein NfuA